MPDCQESMELEDTQLPEPEEQFTELQDIVSLSGPIRAGLACCPALFLRSSSSPALFSPSLFSENP